jgi:hypothetical protein
LREVDAPNRFATSAARADGSAINGLEPDDLTRGEIDGRRQAIEAFAFLRTVPGFERSYIVDLPPQLGIRETRRIGGRLSAQRRGRADLRVEILARIPWRSLPRRQAWPAPLATPLRLTCRCPSSHAIRCSSGVSALRSAVPRWAATAHATASTTLGNSIRVPSPVWW